MKIRVDMNLLQEQIYMCDNKAINASDEHECDLFKGISNLLDAIDYALTYDKGIEFEKVEEEE